MNTEFVKHIEQLLFKSECVIIPGFGAFVAQRRPAFINAGNDRIEPRSKFIAFNPALKQNDGVLVSAIAAAEELSYDDALILVNNWVHQALTALKQERSIQIGRAGSFILGPEEQIIFQPKTPANFDADSYGLQAVYLNQLYADNAEHISPADIEVIPAAQVPAESIITLVRPRRKKAWAALAVMTLLLTAGVIISRNSFFDQTQFSSLNPLNFDSNIIDRLVEEGAKKEAAEVPADSLLPEQPIVPSETTVVEQSESDSVFFAVGGAFAIHTNAVKFTELLVSKGYQPEMIKQPGYRLLRVTYSTSYDRAIADSFLNDVRAKEDPQAWLLALSRKDFKTIQK